MICHIVLYRMKPGKTESDENRLAAEAQRRLASLPGVLNFKAGRSLSGPVEGFVVSLVMDFNDAATLETYKTNPEHVRFVKEIAEPLVSEIQRFDFHWG